MQKIDLDYIYADEIKEVLNYGIYDYILNKINEDLGRLEGYISKYDHDYEYETDVTILKQKKQELFDMLNKIKVG
jgi:hypothetical protein